MKRLIQKVSLILLMVFLLASAQVMTAQQRSPDPATIVVLASAARTATTTTATFNQKGYRGLRLYLNVTVAPGTPGAGGLKVIVRTKEPVSSTMLDLNTGGALVTTAVTRLYEVYPGAAAASGFVQDAISRQLPTDFDIRVTHDDAQSYTYSLAYELLP